MSDRSAIPKGWGPEYPRIDEIWEHIPSGKLIRIAIPDGVSGACFRWLGNDAFGTSPYDNFLPGPAQRFRRRDQ